jgi:hypothetical protein
MTSRSRLLCALLATLVVVLGLGAAGCGGSDELTQAEFQELVVVQRDRVDFALARVPKAKTLEEYTNRMEEAAAVIDDAANELADITPPEVFEPETRKLEKAFRQLAVDYDSTAEQLRETPDLLTGSLGLSFDSWDQANLALAGLAGNGIEVSVLQPHL